MKKFFGRDKQKRGVEEDIPLPLPQPYPLSGSRSSSFSSLPLPTKSIKSEREGRKKQPPAVGILRALDPHVEVVHPGIPTDDRASQYEPSIKDDKRDWKLWERRERERDGERGRNRDRGGRDDDGQAELTRMIGVMIPLFVLSFIVLTVWKAI